MKRDIREIQTYILSRMENVGKDDAILIEEFVKNVYRVFGDREASSWFERLDGILDACIEKWDLSGCILSGTLSMNLICFAQSREFGRVALKIGVPHDDLYSEMDALECFKGRGMCLLYGADRELGAILEERVTPGNDLKSVSDYKARIGIAGDLIRRLPATLPDDHRFPTFRSQMDKAFARARAEGKFGGRMLPYMDLAEGLFRDLEAEGRPLVLRHGDIHHENMLRTADGIWKAIDPKGVAGFACQEAARFMENELDFGGFPDKVGYLHEMAAILSGVLGEPEGTIARCAFIDMILSSCWSLEDNSPDDELVKIVDECQTYLDFVGPYLI